MSRIVKAARVINDEEKYRIEVETPQKPQEQEISNEEDEESQHAVRLAEADRVVQKALSDAEQHLENASREARRILAEAETEANHIRQTAYEEGIKSGKDEGYKKGVLEASGLKSEAERLLAESRADYENALDKAEEAVVELIIDISRKLIGDIADIRPDVIVSLVRRGLTDATVGGTVVIHVSADDYSAAVENREIIQSFIEGSSTVEIMKDLSLQKSDCIIETPYGNIDCSLDRQFSQLRENLLLIYNNRNG